MDDIYIKDCNGNIYLKGSGEYFFEMKKKYPNMKDLYKDQLLEVLKDKPKEIINRFNENIRSYFSKD